jgi:hypothetical protein
MWGRSRLAVMRSMSLPPRGPKVRLARYRFGAEGLRTEAARLELRRDRYCGNGMGVFEDPDQTDNGDADVAAEGE